VITLASRRGNIVTSYGQRGIQIVRIPAAIILQEQRQLFGVAATDRVIVAGLLERKWDLAGGLSAMLEAASFSLRHVCRFIEQESVLPPEGWQYAK